jgi:hypothetical protein
VRQQLAVAALKESYKDIAKASRLFNMRDVTAVLDNYKPAFRNFFILSDVLQWYHILSLSPNTIRVGAVILEAYVSTLPHILLQVQ